LSADPGLGVPDRVHPGHGPPSVLQRAAVAAWAPHPRRPDRPGRGGLPAAAWPSPQAHLVPLVLAPLRPPRRAPPPRPILLPPPAPGGGQLLALPPPLDPADARGLRRPAAPPRAGLGGARDHRADDRGLAGHVPLGRDAGAPLDARAPARPVILAAIGASGAQVARGSRRGHAATGLSPPDRAARSVASPARVTAPGPSTALPVPT